ncbi:MAG: SHOCT domain-containing protein [Ferruginibacter sp.]
MEEKIFKASRVSEGNMMFPAEIHIEETEIMLKIPGFFSGKSRHIIYQQIEAVNIDTPMIGYSTITFVVGGEKIVGHGFTKTEVREIKEICTAKIAASSPQGQREFITTAISSTAGTGKTANQLSVADELTKLKALQDAGVLTQDEFNVQKTKLLNQ